MRNLLRPLLSLLLVAAFISQGARTAFAFAGPVAASFSTAVPVTAQSVIQLQGSDADGTPLVYATTSSPAHGALSNLNAATGAVVYTPAAGYTGADSFNYTVTSGGATSAAGTVTITVTAARTRVIDTLTNPDGSPRQGKVSFFLTQAASSPSGTIPAKASVSAQLSPTGQFDVSLYPSRAVSPVQYYQAWFDDSVTRNTQLLGIYDIPAATTAVTLAGYRVTDANLSAQYVFASKAEVDALTAAVAAATTAQLFPSLTAGKHILWNGSGFANSLISESGGAVTIGGNTTVSGTVTATGYTGIQAANVPNLDASKITTGTLGAARVPNLDASKITTGTFPASVIPDLSAAKITSGTLPNAQTTASSANTPSTIVARDASGNFSAGTVTATNLVGNGAGITGLTGATGGVSNTGSTTVRADSDSDGVGVIDLQTKDGVTGLRVENDGAVNVLKYLKLPAMTKAAMNACLVACSGSLVRVTDHERGEWFNNGAGWARLRGHIDVRADFGAKGDGATDDTAAFAAAVAALNEGNVGELYAPRGAYVTSGGFTITAPFVFRGDGRADAHYDTGSNYAFLTKITCTSPTAVLFTVTANKGRFEGLDLANTSPTTPTAGSAIRVYNATDFLQKVDYERISVRHFYDNINVEVGDAWRLHDAGIYSPVRYGIRIQNTVVPDAGGWSIDNCEFVADNTPHPTAAIRIESCGGAKITNTNILQYTTAISAVSSTTSVLLIANCSFENNYGNAIDISDWQLVTITGNEFAYYFSSGPSLTANAVKLTRVKRGSVIGNVFSAYWNTAAVAVRLDDCKGVRVSNGAPAGFDREVGFDTAYAHDPDEHTTFNTPSYQNGWAAFGAGFETGGYTYDAGWVVLRGMIQAGTVGQTAFTVPVGYRPTGTLIFLVASGSGSCQVFVYNDGRVVPQAGCNNSSVSLSGIRYRPYAAN
jgi:hypothetical protein